MTWRDLCDGCHDYAIETGYCTNRNEVYHKVQILADFMKLYEHAYKEDRANLDIYKMKVEKYGTFTALESWYTEHIHNTVEHEAAGVLMKIAIFAREFKFKINALNDKFHEETLLTDILGELDDVKLINRDNIIYGALRATFDSTDRNIGILNLITGVSNILRVSFIDNIDEYIRLRLENAYLKAIQNDKIK